MSESIVASISRAMYWNTIFRYLGVILQIVSSVIVVHTLGLELYAGFVLISAFVNSLIFFNGLGYGLTFLRFLPELRVRRGFKGLIRGSALLIGVRFVTTSVLILLTIFAMPQVSKYISFGSIVTSFLTLVLLVFVISTFASALEIILRAFLKQREIGVIRTLRTVTFPSLILLSFLFWQTLSLEEVLFALILSELFALCLTTWFVLRFLLHERERIDIKSPCKDQEKSSLSKRATRFSIVALALRSLDYLTGSSFIIILLSTVLGAPQIAAFGLGSRFVSRVFGVLSAPTERLTTPILVNVDSHGGRSAVVRAVRVLLKFSSLSIIPFGLMILLALKPAMSFLYPYDFYRAVGIAQVFTLSSIFISILGVSRSAMLVCERYKPLLGPRFLSLLMLPFSLWAAKNYGVMGAAIAIAIMGGMIGVLQTFFALRELKMGFPFSFLKRILLGILPLSPLVFIGLELELGLLSTVCLIGIMLGIFIITFRVFGGLDQETNRLLERSNIPGSRSILRFF